jgi:hypothetical protein
VAAHCQHVHIENVQSEVKYQSPKGKSRACIQNVCRLYVNTSGAHYYGYFQSHQHRSGCQLLRSYRYFKFDIMWTLNRTSRSFLHVAASKTGLCGTSLPLSLRSHAMFYMQLHKWVSVGEGENVVRWSRWPILRAITINPSVRKELIQVIRHASNEMSAVSACWKYNCDVKIVTNLYPHLGKRWEPNNVHITFLTGNCLRNKFLKYRSKSPDTLHAERKYEDQAPHNLIRNNGIV